MSKKPKLYLEVAGLVKGAVCLQMFSECLSYVELTAEVKAI